MQAGLGNIIAAAVAIADSSAWVDAWISSLTVGWIKVKLVKEATGAYAASLFVDIAVDYVAQLPWKLLLHHVAGTTALLSNMVADK